MTLTPDVNVSPVAAGSSPRFHDLDALRATAMLLGVVLHATLFLIPDAWPIQDAWAGSVPPQESPYGYLLSAIHGFRMPVFFLLSGFFTALLWQRRGLKEMGVHRLKRVALPLAIGSLTIIPINVWLLAGADFDPAWWPVYWLDSLHHLWFLWILLLLVAAFAVAVRLGLQFLHRLWWLAIPATLLPQLLMHEPIFGPDTSDGPVPNPVVLAYYALFFAFGAFCYRRSIVVSRRWAIALIPTLTVIFLSGLVFLYETPAPWAAYVSAVFQATYAWLMCFGLMGLFRWIAARERFWVRYVSDASYWIYLWHLPLVIAGQSLLVGLPLNPHLKFALLCLVVSAILLVVYQIGVRYTPVGTFLNGRRSRRTQAITPRPAGGNA